MRICETEPKKMYKRRPSLRKFNLEKRMSVALLMKTGTWTKKYIVHLMNKK